MTADEHTPTPDGPCAPCEADAEALAHEFRVQLGLDDDAPDVLEGELLPAPDADRAFGLGYAVGRSSVQAEAAADAVFRRARRRRLVLDAVAVGTGWLLGSWLAEAGR